MQNDTRGSGAVVFSSKISKLKLSGGSRGRGNMEELIKNIKEMGLDWFIASLQSWDLETEIDINEVLDDLNEYLSDERSYAPN